MMEICFLFNHDAAHQVAHSIGLAAVLADKYSTTIKTTIAYSGPPIRVEIEQYLTKKQIATLNWHDLSLGSFSRSLLAPLNRIFPALRLCQLLVGASYLRQFKMIVSTERTCLLLKRRWGKSGPLFVYIPHGSGDRNVAYHPALKAFDVMLLSGQKLVDQMVVHDIVSADQCRVIGYPKFDWLVGREPVQFFDNKNPTFVFNPHFDPLLSSWYDHGREILEWFYVRSDKYNLIFAPHVLLFLKSIHISPEYKKGRRRPDIDQKYFKAANIRIDIDSPRLFDMSYTLSADAYIGDVSSQVYEFLYRPRPVFFIDTQSEEQNKKDPEYKFWLNGPVVSDVAELADILPRWNEIGGEYKREQIHLMEYTVRLDSNHSAAELGAKALSELG